MESDKYFKKTNFIQFRPLRSFFVFTKAVVLVGFLFLSFMIPKALAVQIRKVQSGVIDFGVSDVSKTAFILEVDPSKSIILISSEVEGKYDYECLFISDFYDSKTIYVTRSKKGKFAKVSWTVAEFSEGVLVQRGISDIPRRMFERTISLPYSVDLDKSFIITNTKSFNRFMDRTELSTVKTVFSSNKELLFTRRSKMDDVTIFWQIIEFKTDARVESGTFRMPEGEDQRTVFLKYIDVERSFLILNTSGSGLSAGLGEQYYVRGEIKDRNTLEFFRNNAGNDVEVSWFLISLEDGSKVQRGSQNLSTKIERIDLESIDLDRVCVFSAISADINSENLNAYFMRTDLKEENLTFRRKEATPGNIAWYAVEFAPFTLVFPKEEEIFEVGQRIDIKWTTSISNNLGNLKFEWTSDNGYIWNICKRPPPLFTKTDDINSQDITFEWIIPEVEAEVDTDCNFKMTNTKVGFQDYFDKTNGNFTIKSKLELVAPDGAEGWEVGRSGVIRWRYWGNFNPTPKVILEYSTDHPDYANWNVIDYVEYNLNQDDESICSYFWQDIPLKASGDKVKVRVKSINNPQIIYDDSNTFFEIKQNIEILNPKKSDKWPTGYEQKIEWKYNCEVNSATRVNIHYSLDEGENWKSIIKRQHVGSESGYTESIPRGYFLWTPTLSEYGKKVIMRVFLSDSPDIFGEVSFEIEPSIKIGRPNGKEVLRVSQNQKQGFIEWSLAKNTDIEKVNMYYCTDFSTKKTWKIIREFKKYKVLKDKFFYSLAWSIPDDIGNDCGFRIEDSKNKEIYDESDKPFTIKGWIDIHEPSKDIIVDSSRSLWVRWDNIGTLKGKYIISYSKDGGRDKYPVVIARSPRDFALGWERYEWVKPDITNLNQSDSKIKIAKYKDSDSKTGTVGLSSNFTIAGSIKSVKVDGVDGFIYSLGDECTITWDAHPDLENTFGLVEIAYDLYGGKGYDQKPDSGDEFENVIGTTDGYYNPIYGIERYTWVIEGVERLTEDLRIQVRSVSFPKDIVAQTMANSSIQGRLELTMPSVNPKDEALVWECGMSENITWDWQGQLGSVKLYYSKNNGADGFTYIIDDSETIAVTDGLIGYTWVIPDGSSSEESSVFLPENKGLNDKIAIKIMSVEFPRRLYSVSKQPLTIKSRLAKFSGSDKSLRIGAKNYSINWVTTGEIDSVNIRYDILGGVGGYIGDIANNLSNVEGYLWPQINCPLTNQLRIRVESSDYPDDIYVESSVLESKGLLAIISPSAKNRGKQAIIAGENYRIEWSVNGGLERDGAYDLGYLDLYYSSDGRYWGSPFATVPSSGDEFYDWVIPNNSKTSGNKIKIEDVDDFDNVNFISEKFDIKEAILSQEIGDNKKDSNK